MPDLMTPFSIPFNARQVAQAVRVLPDVAPAAALAALDLPPYEAVIVMHGGAGGIDPVVLDRFRAYLMVSLAPFAEEHRVLVVDGGTNSGTMDAMGDARRDTGGTYPLLGISPTGTVSYPTGPAPDESHYPLDPSHSHFVLVEGDAFGVESDLLTGMLQAAGKPGIALIVNGGDIVLKEAQTHARLGNTLVVIRGSGRMADELATPGSEVRATLPPTTVLVTVDLDVPDAFRATLARLLLPSGETSGWR